MDTSGNGSVMTFLGWARNSLLSMCCFLILMIPIQVVAQPTFSEGVLHLPALRIGDELFSLSLALTNPEDFTFTADLENAVLVTGQVDSACFDPYFSFEQNQIVVPVLELGTGRFLLVLDVVDLGQALFRVGSATALLLDATAPTSPPAFSVSQSGNNMVAEWGSPGDESTGYVLWFSPYPSGQPVLMADLGPLSAASLELPIGADFCLAMAATGPNGSSDFSILRQFTNLEEPYSAFATDDASLPTAFLPTLHDGAGLALMQRPAPATAANGAAVYDAEESAPLVVSYHPEHGLLQRVVRGDLIYHFVNYTHSTVDVIETSADGDTRVFPNVRLSNHGITVVEALTLAYEAENPESLTPSEVKSRSARWARMGMEVALDVLQQITNDGESVDADLLEQLRFHTTAFQGDFLRAIIAEHAEEISNAFLANLAERFDCGSENNLVCALHAANQADVQTMLDNYPDTLPGAVDKLHGAITEVTQLTQQLNQDCSALEEADQLACLALQGNPEPGEQEEVLSVNDTQTAADAEMQIILDTILELANANHSPTGDVSITGTPAQGETLTVVDTLQDADGLGPFSYQWYSGNDAIPDADGLELLLTQNEVGTSITVTVSYTDGGGIDESVTSEATADVANVNDEPIGFSAEISGEPRAGSELTVSAAVESDLDGLPEPLTFTYQWQVSPDGEAWSDIDGANSDTFTPGANEVDQFVQVTVSYADNQGTVENTASAAVDIAQALIGESDLQTFMTLNQLSFEYQDLIGQNVWILGFYGDETYNQDGYAFLLDDPTLLDVDTQLPHHSFARLDGNLPPQDWNRSEVLIYGTVNDFATQSSLFVLDPTPLITVIEITQLTPPVAVSAPATTLFLNSVQSLTPPVGTQASACDRVVIISGGVDANNNKKRYREAIDAIYTKMKALGYSDAQIDVFYNNGGTVQAGGAPRVTVPAGKQAILNRLAQLKNEIPGSCTLNLFVSDHGIGQETGKTYGGTLPAFTGLDSNTGVLHAENTFIFDARKKVFRFSQNFTAAGSQWYVSGNDAGEVFLFRREGNSWVFKGGDANNDNFISEAELNLDLDSDGVKKTDFGFDTQGLKDRLQGARSYRENKWDYDGDGTDDVRLRWDGTRYVVERRQGANWVEMGRDTNGDFIINTTDGGVDWNLDGDKSDQIGFHEGINLWGKEVLWDNELADALKELHEGGIHIMGYMASCFSGGFADNLTGFVENIFTGSKEDELHTSRDDGTGKLIHDTKGFLDNLMGIDSESWTYAGDKAVDADTTAAGTGKKNGYTRWETPMFASSTVFQAVDGGYKIELVVPQELSGLVYDFEFIFGLQKPRWDALEFGFPNGLPPGLDSELIPGGFRLFSDSPIPDVLTFLIEATAGSENIRIGLTDVEHKNLGYVMAAPGTVVLDQIVHVDDIGGSFEHFDGFSVIYPFVLITDEQGEPVPDVSVFISINGPDVVLVEQNAVTDANGIANFDYTIFQYGNYVIDIYLVGAPGVQYNSSADTALPYVIVVN